LSNVPKPSGRSDRSALDKALYDLRKVSPESSGELLDVRDGEGVLEWVQRTLGRFGKIDVAIANAGVINPRPFLEISKEQLDDVIDTHLKGTFYLFQAAARAMIQNKTRGALISIAAPSATKATDGVADYASAKGGIVSLTKNVARELAPHGIRANSVVPVADTRMTEALMKYRKTDRASWNKRYPLLGTMPQADDITGPFLFLGSEDSKYVTGQVLGVDAGSGLF
jgi:NAD(P)-dependent dehydrogenase (short-subunit alcohol dehydrogenase family)